ncbi:hypothetical protein I3843_15G099000 [Carya illinoinensis]|nr:hypothetical protein I3843_15G099000 [Carya illinoinensis]
MVLFCGCHIVGVGEPILYTSMKAEHIKEENWIELNDRPSGLLLLFLWNFSYTWKSCANKLLNMEAVPGFWRQMNKEKKLAKQKHIDMFYNLQFRNLGSFYNYI